jgi:hypothetical protein
VGGYGPGCPPRSSRPGYKSLRTARALEEGMVITVEPVRVRVVRLCWCVLCVFARVLVCFEPARVLVCFVFARVLVCVVFACVCRQRRVAATPLDTVPA